MARKFVMGDIHGAYRALRQCLERSAFDYHHDHLIFLGDVADGWPETLEAVEELLRIRNLIFVLGNHDWWTLEWMKTGVAEYLWLRQGGEATVKSYGESIPDAHIRLLENAYAYWMEGNKLFVHAGIDPTAPLEVQSTDTFLWDRSLARIALDFYHKGVHGKLTDFEEVYLGHTPIPFNKPIKSSEVWLLDTGAGWSGVLSMMDLDTKEFFTSDPVPALYRGVTGRKKFVSND
jgi:serine/threonine protein phosphatase 1